MALVAVLLFMVSYSDNDSTSYNLQEGYEIL
jgi:hypothetical protein